MGRLANKELILNASYNLSTQGEKDRLLEETATKCFFTVLRTDAASLHAKLRGTHLLCPFTVLLLNTVDEALGEDSFFIHFCIHRSGRKNS